MNSFFLLLFFLLSMYYVDSWHNAMVQPREVVPVAVSGAMPTPGKKESSNPNRKLLEINEMFSDEVKASLDKYIMSLDLNEKSMPIPDLDDYYHSSYDPVTHGTKHAVLMVPQDNNNSSVPMPFLDIPEYASILN